MGLENENKNDAAAIIDAALAAAEPFEVTPGKRYIMLTPTGEVKKVDTFDLQDGPLRKSGTANPATVASFTDYVNEHASDTTTVWVDQTRDQITAVLDDHDQESAGWGEHRAVLKLQQTEAWKHWAARDGQLLDQEAFATHVEEGLDEIREPNAADMLELAQTVQASTSAAFKSAKRLSSGETQLHYVEEIDARAGGEGQIEIPQEFVLALAPYEGEDAYKVIARFRYRLRGQSLSLGYKLIRPRDVQVDALANITDKIQNELALGNVYLGTPR